jgi:tripartite-type tricarboxylate transporter receptor subunit TctC
MAAPALFVCSDSKALKHCALSSLWMLGDPAMTSSTCSGPAPFSSRRRHLLLGSAALLAAPGAAWSQAYPTKPIRLVVPSAAGGSPDAICRALAVELAKGLGQAVIVDNKPGASGVIGTLEVTRAAPDGLTLGYANVGTLAINQSLLTGNLPYDADKQLVGLALLGHVQNALVVRADLPVKSVAELIAYAKQRPGKLSMGSAGNGTTGHLGGELFKEMAGVFMVHVPYRGSPQAIQDLMGSQVDLMFDNLSSIGSHIRSGRVRALAVSGEVRSPQFPDLPTMAEAGVKGYATVAWGGLVAPAATPPDIVARLHSEINKALSSKTLRDLYAPLAFEVTSGPPNALFERARRERPMWAQVVKRSGASVN